jgi:hypothetical protein
MGNATNHIDYYLAALRLLFGQEGVGRRGGTSIIRVDSTDYAGNRHPLRKSTRTAEGPLFLSLDGLMRARTLPMDNITIIIDTPLRIIHDMKPLRMFSFPLFVRALMRRVSAMAYYCSGIDSDLDFKWLAKQSDSVAMESESFRWVEWGKDVCGVIGYGTFIGDMAEFHPFLLAGEYLHVGKGAAFGLGRFHLECAG